MSGDKGGRFEEVIAAACKLPYCRIDRDEFLTKQLKNKVNSERLADALEYGTVNAGIQVKTLDMLAVGAIKLERTKATVLSAGAGIPGGLALIGAVPADLAQFYAHVLRVAQKLAYIYGYKRLDMDDAIENRLVILLGAMLGVNAANAALAKFAAANASKIGARVAAMPLSKHAVYNIAKKTLAWVGVKLTKDTAGKAVAKAVPLVGALVSGSLTAAVFSRMVKKLKDDLSRLASMSPEDLEKESAAADVILADYEIMANGESADETVLQTPMRKSF
ncbi:MAG: hypothetical protein LBI44_08040 [Oscillospiraceae bacterium]|jgi:uncharacterized membrane protein|nr:hypothetical protein [Oscillospiraceae bacterium]